MADPGAPARHDETRGARRGAGMRGGALAVAFGAAALAGVLCLLFPQHLTTPELRARYPLPLVRAAIQLSLLAGLGCGLAGALRGRHVRLSALGIALSALAAALGGSEVPVATPIPAARNVGLDWFALTLFVTALLFVPIERGFPLRPRQPVIRDGFWTDVAHFGASHLFVGVTLALTMLPAAALFAWAARADVQAFVAAQPFALQLAAAVVLTDLFGYAAHRLFHAVPLLWRFHAIHHSSEVMDWLAGSRLHLVDAIATRAAGFMPLYVLGFSPRTLTAYLLLVSFQAVFIHANVRWRLAWIGWLVATPRFHHWHHAAEPQALDKNFAVHLPVIDRIFGTYYQPERFPERYGIAGRPVPPGFLRQVVWPFLP